PRGTDCLASPVGRRHSDPVHPLLGVSDAGRRPDRLGELCYRVFVALLAGSVCFAVVAYRSAFAPTLQPTEVTAVSLKLSSWFYPRPIGDPGADRNART